MKKSTKKQSAATKKVAQALKPLSFPPLSEGKKRVLHVGCGLKKNGSGLHSIFRTAAWEEVRLDIDPAVEPDIVADIRSMPMIPDGSIDAIWSSHNLEHVFTHEVPVVLAECYRILKTDGFLVLATPDIEKVAEAICEKGLDTPLYHSPAGPVAPIDVLYGFGHSLKQGRHFMAHKTAFTAKSLAQKLLAAGFLDIKVIRQGYHLEAVGVKRAEVTEENKQAKIYKTA